MKRGPERIQRWPDHGAPMFHPHWPVILKEAKAELDRVAPPPNPRDYHGPIDVRRPKAS